MTLFALFQGTIEMQYGASCLLSQSSASVDAMTVTRHSRVGLLIALRDIIVAPFR